jgi:glutamate--cysteine ligase
MQSLRQRIDNPETTPSAQVLAATREHGGFFKYAMQQTLQHHQHLLAQPLDSQATDRFVASAETSLREQHKLEAAEQGSFEDFVAAYYA